MEQKSNNWLQWRLGGIGSSDAPVIMGVSPYQTPFQLWEIKTGRKIPEEKSNFVMDRGNELEPVARARYELENDMDMPAECCQHADIPWLRASMDGWNPKERRGLEIKYLGEKDFALAESGQLPPRYFPQVMHQFLVTGADRIDFYGYNVPKGAENHKGKSVVVPVYQDPEYIRGKLWPAEKLFWSMVETNIPPPFMDGDYKPVRVAGAKALAQAYTEMAGAGMAGTTPFSVVTDKIMEMTKEHERARMYNLRIQSNFGVRIIKIVGDAHGDA